MEAFLHEIISNSSVTTAIAAAQEALGNEALTQPDTPTEQVAEADEVARIYIQAAANALFVRANRRLAIAMLELAETQQNDDRRRAYAHIAAELGALVSDKVGPDRISHPHLIKP